MARRYSNSTPIQIWAGTPTTLTNLSAVSGVIILSPLKFALNFGAGRFIRLTLSPPSARRQASMNP